MRIARLLLGLGSGHSVLDVACGPGNFTRSFGTTVGEHGLAVGIDASETMLERGVRDLERTGVSNVCLLRGDATRTCRSPRAASTRSAALRRYTCSPIRSRR